MKIENYLDLIKASHKEVIRVRDVDYLFCESDFYFSIVYSFDGLCHEITHISKNLIPDRDTAIKVLENFVYWLFTPLGYEVPICWVNMLACYQFEYVETKTKIQFKEDCDLFLATHNQFHQVTGREYDEIIECFKPEYLHKLTKPQIWLAYNGFRWDYILINGYDFFVEQL